MLRNLETFYSVTRCSGGDTYLFTSYEEAQFASDKWTHDIQKEFDKGNTAVAEFNRDGTGLVLRTTALPGGIFTHNQFSTTKDKWEGCIGVDSIKWGNPTLQRPTTNKVSKPKIVKK